MSKSSRRDSEQDERSGQGKGTDAKAYLGKAWKEPAKQNSKTTDRTKKQRKRELQRFDPAKTFVAWARGIGERYAERAQVRKRRREERKSMPRKRPMFARLFNWVLPGDYSPQDDKRHVIIVSVLIIALVGLLASSAFKWSSYISYQTSDMILIPSTSFIETQTDSVTEELEKQGFKDIEKDESGNIIGHGTPEMVDAYKQSYKEKNFDDVRDAIVSSDFSAYGIERMELSSDWKTLTLTTYTDDNSSALIDYMLTSNSAVQEYVNELATWCQLYYDGQELTISFVSVEDKAYLTREIRSVSELISSLEADENEKSQIDSEKQPEGDSSNTNESDDESADSSGNEASSDNPSEQDDSATNSQASDGEE